ncbi:MAG TPA: MFS transporter [Acidimicrobiales bacterium]|nr:MFS transporter [Acidimicrobiales bacterium]
MAEPTGDTAGQPRIINPADPIPDRPSTIRLFGSGSFFRLWLAQVVSSLGDWIGFVAITAIAARVGGSSPEASIGLVLSARLLPGMFLAPMAGVFIDRWNRKHVMVACSIGRGVVLLFLPAVDTVVGLFFISLLLEILGLMWSPAKEASVPRLVAPEQLATANSLGLVAAYGTFPVATLVFALLAKVAQSLSHYDALSGLAINQENVAIWFYVLTAFLAAVMISTLRLPHHRTASDGEERLRVSSALSEVAEGWRYIGSSPLVRAVMLGMATGLIGGGMLVPLGPVFSRVVLGGGSAGFGLLLTGLGTGGAVGIVLLSVVQRRLPHERAFVVAVIGCGMCIIGGASMSALLPAMLFVSTLGLCAGAVYVLGFTIIQTQVDDQLRGRIFATLYTLVRVCLLLAFALAPILSSVLDKLSDRLLDRTAVIGAWEVALPGVRLTLWLGGLIILAAGLLALRSLRPSRDPAATSSVSAE